MKIILSFAKGLAFRRSEYTSPTLFTQYKDLKWTYFDANVTIVKTSKCSRHFPNSKTTWKYIFNLKQILNPFGNQFMHYTLLKT